MARCPEQDCSESDGELGISVSLTWPLMNCLPMAIILALTKRGVMSMPRKLPPHVERNHVKGHTYLSFRRGKGPRVRLPKDPTSEEHFRRFGENAENERIRAEVMRLALPRGIEPLAERKSGHRSGTVLFRVAIGGRF